MVAVSDSGVGMDAATQAHLFEPFFTTKEKGKGTGLGLATVYGIVKQSGGDIWVYSELGRGTTFKIYFPAVKERVEPRDVRAAAPEAAPQGLGTILLVEDEEAVRKLAASVLRKSGYAVLEAPSGPDALEVASRHAGKIHLLVTDVVMPRMSGRELAKRLVEARPGLPVLFVSGYTTDAIVQNGVLDPGVSFLQKPFTSADLIRRAQELLKGP
jgi:CheY-like chemotaxis protein